MSGKRKGPPILYTPVLVDVIDLDPDPPAKSKPERDVVVIDIDVAKNDPRGAARQSQCAG